MSYTVIGDAVNLGARLESLNKEYGTRIIISEATRAALPGRYLFRPLGDVVVKGKTKPVAIFEVVAGQGDAGMKTVRFSSSRFSLSALPRTRSWAASASRVQQAQERKQQFDDLNITEDEEVKLGADVSAKIRQRFGVVQDPAVHKYVTLVGTMLTRADRAGRSCRGPSSCSTPTASTRSRRLAASCTSRAARSR